MLPSQSEHKGIKKQEDGYNQEACTDVCRPNPDIYFQVRDTDN
jgi:hypothetical protein